MTTDSIHLLNPRAGWGARRWSVRLVGIALLLAGAVPLITLAESIEAESRLDCESSCSTEFSEPLACSVSRLPTPDRATPVTGYAPPAGAARSSAQSRRAGQQSGHRLPNGLMAPLRN